MYDMTPAGVCQIPYHIYHRKHSMICMSSITLTRLAQVRATHDMHKYIHSHALHVSKYMYVYIYTCRNEMTRVGAYHDTFTPVQPEPL